MAWTDCLEALRHEMADNLFTLWIRPLIAEEHGHVLSLYAPNAYFSKHITDNYIERIRALAFEYSKGVITDVQVKFSPTTHKKISLDDDIKDQDISAHSVANLNIADINNQSSFNIQPEQVRRTLNKGYVFQEFVEGPTNKMAFETCKTVVNQLGDSKHNPLFLYGATGLGKTHLMQAVGHAVLDKSPNARVMYMTSEQFVSGFVTALQQQRIDKFKKDCRTLDLLLVDDIQFLAGKAASLEEFFNTFNELLTESKQIILTSDRYPKEITEMDARLVSRFSWGLSIAVEPPELENRVDILLRKAKSSDYELPRNCALFIAQQVQANVRELEGALNKVIATARFKGVDISIEIIKEALKDQISIRARQISVENIQKVVVEYFRIPMRELIGSKRTRVYVRPRQIAMGLSRELTGDSFPEIGSAFGGRDHTTVMHACDKVVELCKTDPAFAADYKNLLRMLQG
ncbi:chromosomal replication initiator protein DnaA [Aquirhabdus parva]|uniref:Chromosomal replication initiator protein DnaA n=1 Tax=Aquirhabdus parva TaxID=2283318 RepID=A0A345PAJ8_9GAMM|nr:chromosomal replication initiator protein DnaA [Aquirhabdus parva]AXI04307.1 chromosomal replication initiator protein DnaA [Aquirhabdus parva]